MSLILCKPARVDAAGGGEGAGDVRGSYDRVANEYARRIADELDGKPFDRALLDRLDDELRGAGPVCDLGCGPGHVGRYLADRGVEVVGVDLSPGMLDVARLRNPGMTFLEGDMRALPVPDGSWAAIVCFYAIVHLAPGELPAAFAEFRRVLRPGGRVVVAFHIGDEVVHTGGMVGPAGAPGLRLPPDGRRRRGAGGVGVPGRHRERARSVPRRGAPEPSDLRGGNSGLSRSQKVAGCIAAWAATACTARSIRLGARTLGPSWRNAASEASGRIVR
jgi:SAM-dependent methyltransferase